MGDRMTVRNTAALLCITPDLKVLVRRVDPNRSETLPNSCTFPLSTKRPEDDDWDWSAMLKAVEAAVHGPVSALLFAGPSHGFRIHMLESAMTLSAKSFQTYKICYLHRYDGDDEDSEAPLTLRDGMYALPFTQPDAPRCLRRSCRFAWQTAFTSAVQTERPYPKIQTLQGFIFGINSLLQIGLMDFSPALNATSEAEVVKASTIRFRASGITVRFDKYRKDARGTSLPLVTIVGKMMNAPVPGFAEERAWVALAQTCEAGTQAQEPIGPTLLGGQISLTDKDGVDFHEGQTPGLQSPFLSHQYFVMRWVGANLAETDVREVSNDALKDFFRRYRDFNVRSAAHYNDKGLVYKTCTLALDIDDVRTLLDAVDVALQSAEAKIREQCRESEIIPLEWLYELSIMAEARKRVARRALSERADALERLEDLKAPRRDVACHGELHTGNVTFLSPTSARTAEKRLYAVDWSDAYLGPWFLESIPFAQHFDTDEDGARSKEILNMFLQSVGDQLHPGLSLQDATAIFDLARPFRYLRRCIMVARMFDYPGELDETLFQNLLLDITEYLNKAAGSLLSNEYCRDEDTNWSDCDDVPPMAYIPMRSLSPSSGDGGMDGQVVDDGDDGQDLHDIDDDDDMDVPFV